METDIFDHICFFFIRFKSYYVVWKLLLFCLLFIATRCLNRTMQYGNHTRVSLCLSLHKFKSYYVVWKPSKRTQHFGYRQSFKSYYVVWKPDNARLQIRTSSMFKSYYVVWKLPTAIGIIRPAWKFKSYYVVWKPGFFSCVRTALTLV